MVTAFPDVARLSRLAEVKTLVEEICSPQPPPLAEARRRAARPSPTTTATAAQTPATDAIGEDGGTFVAAAVLSAAAALLSRPVGRPPKLLLVLAGFFTLTVGSPGVRGLTTLVGGHPIQGFRDLLDLVTLVVVIATGMLLGTAATSPRTRR